jgi:hypothetical protein
MYLNQTVKLFLILYLNMKYFIKETQSLNIKVDKDYEIVYKRRMT